MLEANPGPGAGLLLAYLFFGPRSLRPTVPAALIIQFFGGIHEIYFPYVLMRPRTILATIAGGASGIAIFQLFDVGLSGPAAPGSFIAFMGVTAEGRLLRRDPRNRSRSRGQLHRHGSACSASARALTTPRA